MTHSVDPDQSAPIETVCSGSNLFASIVDSSVMLGGYLQKTTSADVIFQMHFFLGALNVNKQSFSTQAITSLHCWFCQDLVCVTLTFLLVNIVSSHFENTD